MRVVWELQAAALAPARSAGVRRLLGEREDEPHFETWDVVSALSRATEAPPHYKTIATCLDGLVEKGYLHRDPGPGGPGGRHVFRVAISKCDAAPAFVDRVLDQLGDDPDLLELAERRARSRRNRPRTPAARR
jgi:predicted transcriptional regulator